MDKMESFGDNDEDSDKFGLSELAAKLHGDANYFDEAGQYERMNRVDKAVCILKVLEPILNDVLDERKSIDVFKSEHGEFNIGKYYAMPMEHLDNLLNVVEKARNMKPFGLEDWQ